VKFRSLLVANRGEIALRVMRTAKRMGLRTIAVYSDADRDTPHVHAAVNAVHIGAAAPRESYLNAEAILAAAKHASADSIHPGYGFLSENAAFAEAVIKAGLAWIGPSPAAMRAMGDKANAKAIAAKAGVPVLPTYEKDPEFPVMIKALAGGGGRGMRLVKTKGELEAALKSAQSEAEHSFGDGRVLLEKALLKPRHVEVQVFADTQGNCIHLGERDCSVQRRHQKLVEESPSPAVGAKLREQMGAAAVALARAVGYVGAGTVEFLLGEDGRFWFMEMNTRLQVEHPVTELVTGLDLVEWQLRVASGEPLPLKQEQVRFQGHAIEARLCAENPERGHLPGAGRLGLWRPPAGVRTDHALESGIEITPHYDSLIAKLIVHAPTRDEARAQLGRALESTVALGIRTNRWFLSVVVQNTGFGKEGATTAFLDDFHPATSASLGMDAAALAAVILTEAEGRKAGYGEWLSWSNNAQRSMRRRLWGVGYWDEVLLQRENGVYTAMSGKLTRKVRVLELAEDFAKLEIDGILGQSIPYYLGEGRICIACHQRDWLFEDATHLPPERRRSGLAQDIRAPMNGRVVAVHAKPGDSVEENAILVVLEAMKMEHQLAAPAKAKVKAVHVAAGAQVAPGKLLIEFEAAA
jgi:geranyl-CoA carboxylase alpha subunit